MDHYEKQILQLIPNLRRYAHALCIKQYGIDADDLVQECLAKAIDKFHLWKTGTNLRAWLFTIMHNQYVNLVKKSANESRKNKTSIPIETPVNADSQAPGMSDIENALEKLATDQKSILLLVTLEGLSYQEVADILDVPVGTVMSRLSRARRRLREILFDTLDDNIRYLK